MSDKMIDEEIMAMVASIDLTNTRIFKLFEEWKKSDGTKDGLRKLINISDK